MARRIDSQRRRLTLAVGALAADVGSIAPTLHPGRARRPLDETLLDLFEWLYHHRPSNADMRDLLASARMRDR